MACEPKYKFSTDFGEFGVCLLFIFFWGKPDIADAIIHYLMK